MEEVELVDELERQNGLSLQIELLFSQHLSQHDEPQTALIGVHELFMQDSHCPHSVSLAHGGLQQY